VRDGDPVLGAALVAPGLRGFPLGDGHERLGTIPGGGLNPDAEPPPGR
jgi:hypothetical protein